MTEKLLTGGNVVFEIFPEDDGDFEVQVNTVDEREAIVMNSEEFADMIGHAMKDTQFWGKVETHLKEP